MGCIAGEALHPTVLPTAERCPDAQVPSKRAICVAPPDRRPTDARHPPPLHRSGPHLAVAVFLAGPHSRTSPSSLGPPSGWLSPPSPSPLGPPSGWLSSSLVRSSPSSLGPPSGWLSSSLVRIPPRSEKRMRRLKASGLLEPLVLCPPITRAGWWARQRRYVVKDLPFSPDCQSLWGVR